MIVERYIAKSKTRVDAGKHTIVVDTTLARPAAPADIVLSLDGKEVAKMTTKRTVPLAFTASETFDLGAELDPPFRVTTPNAVRLSLKGRLTK